MYVVAAILNPCYTFQHNAPTALGDLSGSWHSDTGPNKFSIEEDGFKTEQSGA